MTNGSSTDNNFTALRILCAVFVVLGHFYYLKEGDPLAQTDILSRCTGFGVKAFFVISGFLVAGSFDRQGQVLPFYLRRFFRIYPLYFVVILMQAAAMTVLLVGDSAFRPADLVRYLAWNSVFANFREPDLGGLLDPLVVHAVNPSLWTLKVELMFYAILPFLHRFYLRFGAPLLLVLFVASTVYYELLVHDEPALARQLPGQIRYFVCGMALWYWREPLLAFVGRNRLLAIAVGIAALVGALSGSTVLVDVVRPITVAAFVFVAAFALPFRIAVPDVSYGLYLIHGPLIQLALVTGLYRDDWLGLTLVISLATSIAWLCWRGVERPFIALGRRTADWASRLRVPQGRLTRAFASDTGSQG